MTPSQAIPLLKTQIDRGKALIQSNPFSNDAQSQWDLMVKNHLEGAFGQNADNVTVFTNIGEVEHFSMAMDDRQIEQERRRTIQKKIALLEGMVELLETMQQHQAPASAPVATIPVGKEVFLVHGHDRAALREVESLLNQLKQKVVVLGDQVNHAKTIIEKFEHHAADVGFAVVLLTADDKGGPASAAYESLQPRARQNVILELGYFIAKLSRKRVCPLLAKGVEVPSDYAGVVYVELDESGAWKTKVAKEMRAADLDVDLNLL